MNDEEKLNGYVDFIARSILAVLYDEEEMALFLKEIGGKNWLREWIKAGSPVDQHHPDFDRQVLVKATFEAIIEKVGGIQFHLDEEPV